MITTFVFDWGNVLEFIDYFGFNKHFCKTYSISLDDFRKEELNNRLKLDAGIIGLEEFFKNLEKSLNVKIDSKKYYHVRFSEYVTLNKELLRIIKKIKKQGYKLFILSNNNPLFYHHMKENLDFEKVFDKIYLSFQQKMTKSDVNFFF